MPSKTIEDFAYQVRDYMRSAEVVEGKNKLPFHTGMIASQYPFISDTIGYMSMNENNDFRGWTFMNSNEYINLKAGTYKVKIFQKTAKTAGYLGFAIKDANGTAIFDKTTEEGFNSLISGYGTFTLSADTSLGIEYKIGNGSYAFQIVDENEDVTTYEPYFEPLKDSKLNIANQQVLGAWNQLKNDGLATSTTEGATFTKNSDLSVTINRGTATTNASYYNVTSGTNGEVTETRESGTYYISGIPSGSTGLTLQYYDVTANQSWNDSGSGAEITVVKGHTIKVSMRVAPNQTLSNVTVKPMISLEPNQPYVPYAMTNRELTEYVSTGTWQSATVNTSAVSGGTVKYCIKNGICFVEIMGIKVSSAGNGQTIAMGLPKPYGSTFGMSISGNYSESPLGNGFYISDNSDALQAHIKSATYQNFCSLVYIVR